jgi:DNA-binding NtrC family response regulator
MSTTTIRESTVDDSGEVTNDELHWSLTLVHKHDVSSGIGKRVVLVPEAPLVLGRDVAAFGNEALNDPRISREHAVIRVEESDRVSLQDLGSRNGTHVNGKQASQTVRLRDGDIIRMGSVLLLAHRAPKRYQIQHNENIVGQSHKICAAVESLAKVAAVNTTVLLLGPTGTGKEIAARELHRMSGRSGPFCAINCGALPDTLLQSELFGHVRGAFSGADADRTGLIEAASDGTLLLDEIGDSSPSLQRTLLRFLQEGEIRRLGSSNPTNVNTRVVCATHRDILAARGDFREDLLSRLSHHVVRLPSLTERIEDVPLLVHHFLAKHGDRDYSIHWRFIYRLMRHAWPHNVRQLEGVVQRALIETGSADTIEITPALDALLRDDRSAQGGKPAAREPQTSRPRGRKRPPDDQLRALMQDFDGNVTALATHLGVARTTLYRWLEGAGLDVDEYRTS